MSAHVKRLTALLLSLSLALGLVCTSAWGADTTQAAIPTETETQVNPIYDGELSSEETEPAQQDSPNLFSDITYYTNLADAGTYVREQMKNRKSVITLGYKINGSYDGLVRDIIEEAMAHTRVPTEGDYLRYQYSKWESKLSGLYYTITDTYQLEIEYTFTYMTTASQEAKVDKAISTLRSKLNLKGKSRAEKIQAIYDYICDNISYDTVHVNDSSYKLKHSAYAALINHTAVCQGYAVLFYRLLLEEQVDCRVIAGTGTNTNGDSGPHAWNIARIGSEYYDLDATWDSQLLQAYRKKGMEVPAQFYLCSDPNFLRHARYSEYQTKAFYKQYPMSSKSYSAKKAAALAKAHNKDHSWLLWSEHASTYTKAGNILYTCTVCGDSHKDAIPKRNAITASSVTKTAATKAQTFALKATAKGGTLSYKPSNSKVKVSSAGKVTLPKNYVGKCKIAITAKGNGYETAKKTVTVTVNPKGVSLSSVKNVKKKKIKVTWKKNTAVTGYHIQYATSSGFKSAKTVTIAKPKTDHTTLKSLTKGKTYYVRVQTYKKVSGKEYKSGWSGVKKVKVTK